MTTQFIEKTLPVKEQRFVLPGYYTWEQFEAIEALMADAPGLRITYLDGCIEFMTLGEDHELIKSIIGSLLEIYFFEKRIEYIPVGSATRRGKDKGSSFEPDESYYLGERKEVPDLAIEVAITSGDSKKLDKYKRFRIPEVWFWENKTLERVASQREDSLPLSIYRFRDEEYEQITRSEFLPELDLALLVRCVLMPSRLEAMTEFLKVIREQGR